MCARFQSSHVQTPADRQSRAHSSASLISPSKRREHRRRHRRFSPESSSPARPPVTVHLHRSTATRSFLSATRSRPGSSLIKFEPPPSRAPSSPTRHQVSPTSSSSTPTTPTAERLLPDVHVDEPSLRKPPHLPLLFPRSYD